MEVVEGIAALLDNRQLLQALREHGYDWCQSRLRRRRNARLSPFLYLS